MIRETRVRRWLLAQLLASPALAAEVGANVGPTGSLGAGRGIGYSLGYAEALTPIGTDATVLAEVFDWDVEAWGDGWSDLALEAAADAVDAALDGKTGVQGGVNIACFGRAAVVAPEDVDGQRVAQRLGRRYRTVAT